MGAAAGAHGGYARRLPFAALVCWCGRRRSTPSTTHADNVRFPPIADISVASAFDPLRTSETTILLQRMASNDALRRNTQCDRGLPRHTRGEPPLMTPP